MSTVGERRRGEPAHLRPHVLTTNVPGSGVGVAMACMRGGAADKCRSFTGTHAIARLLRTGPPVHPEKNTPGT